VSRVVEPVFTTEFLQNDFELYGLDLGFSKLVSGLASHSYASSDDSVSST
jgi:hypothetical protein